MNLSWEMFRESTEVIRDIKLPIRARFEKIGILEFSPNKQLVKFDLGQ